MRIILKNFLYPIIISLILFSINSCDSSINQKAESLSTKPSLDNINKNKEDLPVKQSLDSSENIPDKGKSKQITFKIKLDKTLFQKKSLLNINISNNEDVSTCSFNPDVEKEPRPCALSDYENKFVNEEFSFNPDDFEDEILITSDKFNINEKFLIKIEGKSNGKCINNTINGEFEGEIKENIVEVDNISFNYYSGNCLSGKIIDVNGNKIDGKINFFTLYNGLISEQVVIKDSEYIFEDISNILGDTSKEIEVLIGVKGFSTKREKIILSKSGNIHNIVLKKHNKSINTKLSFQFDKSNLIREDLSLGKRQKVDISIEINGLKRKFSFDPRNKNDIEIMEVNNVYIGDLYKINLEAGIKGFCNTYSNRGVGIITSNNMFPLEGLIDYSLTGTLADSEQRCPDVDVVGKVTDFEGNLLDDVLVEVKLQKHELDRFLDFEEKTVSNNGSYEFKDLPRRVGLIFFVSKDGYKSVNRYLSLPLELIVKNPHEINFTEGYSMKKL